MAKPTGKESENNPNRDQRGRFRKGNTEGNRWPKGVSGNPSGRVKNAPSIVALLRRALGEKDGARTVARAIVDAAIEKAKAGDFRYFQEIVNRIDGKVEDRIEVAGSGLADLSDAALMREIIGGVESREELDRLWMEAQEQDD